MNIDKLSQYLGIRKSSLYSMVERREIPYYKIGRLLRFKSEDIDAWIAGLKFEVIMPQAKVAKIIKRVKPDIGRILKKNVATAKSIVYTPNYGRPDEIKDLGKEASDV